MTLQKIKQIYVFSLKQQKNESVKGIAYSEKFSGAKAAIFYYYTLKLVELQTLPRICIQVPFTMWFHSYNIPWTTSTKIMKIKAPI